MKQIANTIANRINLTLAMAEAFEGIEFTKKQFEDARRHLAQQETGRSCRMEYLPLCRKAFSLSNLCEEGYIKLTRQETFEKEVEVLMCAVIHDEDLLKNADEWTPLFKGSRTACDDYRWNMGVNQRKDYTVVYYGEEPQMIQAKRNYYTFDRAAVETLVAKMVEKIYE